MSMYDGRFYETTLPDGVLELLADILICSAPAGSQGRVYTERQMNRAMRRNEGSGEQIEMVAADTYMHLDEHKADDILNNAGLSDEEMTVWNMHYRGYRRAEISRALLLSDDAVIKMIRSALYKMNKMDLPYRGLSEVYYQEVHRPIYSEPKHCHEKPCRRLGYCRYAHVRGRHS
jgi:hypothetical protein